MKNKIWNGKYGPLIIAEIGGNHEGNFNYAKKLVQKAIKSGVDVVKSTFGFAFIVINTGAGN